MASRSSYSTIQVGVSQNGATPSYHHPFLEFSMKSTNQLAPPSGFNIHSQQPVPSHSSTVAPVPKEPAVGGLDSMKLGQAHQKKGRKPWVFPFFPWCLTQKHGFSIFLPSRTMGNSVFYINITVPLNSRLKIPSLRN